MAIIGLMGYLGIGSLPTDVFSFFFALLGNYSLVIPSVCLIFAVVCWLIARKPKIKYTDDFEEAEAVVEKEIPTRLVKPNTSEKKLLNLQKSIIMESGFSDYFAGETKISHQQTEENKLKTLGNNYSTYFGEGERNIFLPAKTINLNGFSEYFRDSDLLVNDHAVNETVIHSDRKLFTGTVLSATQDKPITDIPVTEPFKDERIKYENIRIVEEPASTDWQLPSLDLLRAPVKAEQVSEEHNARLLEEVLGTFGVTAKVINITMGPVITRYELSPAPGTKISRIVNLSDDIALALASRDIRIEAPIPGKAAVGIEIPRKHPRTVYFRDVIDSDIFRDGKGKMRMVLGKDIANDTVVSELEKMPHLLVAGATGSGKSIFINCLINSLLYSVTPDHVRFLMIDPKMVELSQYNGIPHLLSPVVTDPKKANNYLKHIVKEMENRYELFATNGVRDIEHYNRAVENKKLPYIVVIIDELADLMMVASSEVEESICRLAQMARAAGIHLVIATQRPSVNVITGLIKANIPSRISFAVSSQIDSRTILDTGGAEKLLGKGDMLYSPIGLNKPLRIHGCFIDEQEVKNVIEHWKNQRKTEFMLSEEQIEESAVMEKSNGDFDEKFTEAAQLVITTGIASVSFLQRRLRVGYSRAARLMDMLEEAGVVSAYEGNKPRDILMSLDSFNNTF